MAKTVFRPSETKVENDKVMLPLVRNYAPEEEVEEEVVEEYTGPTVEELKKEADAFKFQFEQEKQVMLKNAQAEADSILKKAEDAAFAEVKRQTDQAAIIKTDAENEAAAIIEKAKQDRKSVV